MKHINRDNFRHLTGLGRDYAAFVDYIASNWEMNTDGALPTGNLIVKIDERTNEFCGHFIPHADHLPVEESIAGHEPTRELTLSLIVNRNGLCEITALPLVMVLADAPDYSRYYHVYQHHFLCDGEGNDIENGCYTGITKRGWRTRWSEHLRSALSGSNYRFHRAIRQWHETAQITMHTIVAICPSERAAMAVEEDLVERETLYPLGLNMVPGGNAGLAYLRKIGAIGANERIGADDRQAVVNRFFENTSRKGLPNPLAAANWLDQSYAERVICGGPDRLKPQQIRHARFLASLGRSTADIAATVGANSSTQIKRVLSGTTYSRIL